MNSFLFYIDVDKGEREREKKRKYLNLSDLIDHQERKIIFSLYKVLNFSCKKKKNR